MVANMQEYVVILDSTLPCYCVLWTSVCIRNLLVMCLMMCRSSYEFLMEYNTCICKPLFYFYINTQLQKCLRFTPYRFICAQSV